jgi:divinyl chlorophyllide a 8-vinyl-reductase
MPWLQVLPIGGPGDALDPVQQADLLFGLLGTEPKTFKVPVGLMDFIIGTLDLLGNVAPNLKEAAEFGRIGKYYATESMLVYDETTGKYDADATPSYGKETLEMFFDRVLKEGMQGQELGDQAVFGQK